MQNNSPIVDQWVVPPLPPLDVPMPPLPPLDVTMPVLLPSLDGSMPPLPPLNVPTLPPFDNNMMDISNMSRAELLETSIDDAALSDLNNHGDGGDSDNKRVESLLHSCAVNVKTYLTTGEMVGYVS